MRRLLYAAITLLLVPSIFAQHGQLWTDVSPSSFTQRGPRLIQPAEYRLLEVDFDHLKAIMNNAPLERTVQAQNTPALIEIPMPDGQNLTFEVVSSPIYEEGFAQEFPEIKTFAGVVSDRPDIYGRFDVTHKGFHAMIMQAGKTTVFIDPYTFGGEDLTHYMSYDRSSLVTTEEFSCGVTSTASSPQNFQAPNVRTPFASCLRREYRLAISASGEYTSFHGGTVSDGAAGQVTTMNRVNMVFERDLGIRMNIIGSNAQIIYTDANTDPFTDGNAGTMIGQNQTNTDAVIGSANYDVGHIFSIGGSGLAGLGVVCVNGQKARGVTGRSSPIGDAYDIDYVAHELGHQFGANHTQNNNCNRVSAAAHEPGSASTIMGYAGICAPNIQNNSDDHFHGYSLEEMGNFVNTGNGATCASFVDIGNSHPTIVSVPTGLTIPGGTPFDMTVVATDAEGDPMTYCWEQIDPAIATMPPSSTATGGPAFRSNSPVLSPTRSFPNLPDQLAGVSPVWEVLSDVDRTYNFRVSVRDNNVGGSCTEYQDAQITVDGDSGPFLTVNPSAAGITWSAGSTQSVTWAVAGTDVAPVSCANVDILLSTDGGLTFPVTLASNTPNDGAHDIIVPGTTTSTARVRVACADNIFYDISDNDFTISTALESPCQGGFAGIYPCNKFDLVNHMTVSEVGGGAGIECNDIWGWTDPLDGKEYAILGLTSGTSFIDISDPSNPIHLGNLATNTSNSSWRDIKVYNNHAFIVSEAPGHGMQVFDLTNLRNISSPPLTFAADAVYTGFGSAHNIVINEQSGFAYGVGAGTFSGGLHFVDITNPLNPTSPGGFDADGYTHDAQVIIYDGPDPDYQGSEIAFASNEDTFTIIEVSDKTNPSQVARIGYAGSAYTHQGWLTEDRQYFLINDELDENNNGHNTRTYIWDVNDLDAPFLVGFHEHTTAAIDHNLYVKGNNVYQSNYRAGLRVLDLTDLANGNLTEVGYFDVYPANDASNFNGSWSNYPYFQSGNIIISSIEDGLFIVAPSPPVICSEPIGLAATNATPTGADLSWNETGSASIWDIEIVSSGSPSTGVPSVEDLTSPSYTFNTGTPSTAYDYYVRSDCGGITGDGESFWVGPFTFVTAFNQPQGITCNSGAAANLLSEEFDAQGAWTGDVSTVVTDYGSWIVGHSGETFSSDTGPLGAFSGENYVYYESSNSVTNTASLISPVVDLSSAELASGAELSFYMHAYGQSVGTLTVGVGTSATGPFSTLFTWSGQYQSSNAEAWVPIGIDLAPYLGQQVFIEFAHTGVGDYRGDLSLDKILVQACGSFCLTPSGLSASATVSGADLSWIENGSSAEWEIEVVSSGTSPTGSPTVSGLSSTSHAWTDGTSNTAYDFYVRSVCGPNDYSAWIGPVSFTTPEDFCSGDLFTDDGGIAANYTNDITRTTVICPSNGGHVEAVFSFFDVEDRSSTTCWDELFIYDGPADTDPIITPSDLGLGSNTTGGFCWDPNTLQGTGDLVGSNIMSTHSTGCLTFVFVSDGSVSEPGWEASVTCVNDCPWDLVPNGTIDIDDFLALNSAFGSTCTGCPEDMNNDGIVNVDDFLMLNSVYGQNCADLFSPDGEVSSRIRGLNSGLLADLEQGSYQIDEGLEEVMRKMSEDQNLILFPNPSNGETLNVRLIDGQLSDVKSATIYDIAGRAQVRNVNILNGLIKLPLELSAGMYFLEIQMGDHVLSESFIVE